MKFNCSSIYFKKDMQPVFEMSRLLYMNLQQFVFMVYLFWFTPAVGQPLFGKMKMPEPGKVYIMNKATPNCKNAIYFEEDFVLKIESVQFETVQDTLFVDPFYRPPADQTRFDVFQVKIKDEGTYWKYLPCLDRNCFGNPNHSVGFAVIESPAEYHNFRKSDIVDYKIYDVERLMTLPKITMSERKFEGLDFGENEYIRIFENEKEKIIYMKFKAGYWMPWRDHYCSHMHNSCDPIAPKMTVRLIQQKLRARGYYQGPDDNILGASVKAALIRFQKDNHLPVGSLNLETLHCLGLRR